LGVGRSVPASVRAAEAANVYRQVAGSTVFNTYDIKPTYAQVQDPVTLAMDMRALIALTER
jgi:hypothetical protein